MRKKPSTPPAAPRAGQRPPKPIARKPPKARLSAAEKKAIAEAESKLLGKDANLGDSAEEIVKKGLALIQVKRKRLWKDLKLRGFKGWVKAHVTYEVAHANDLIRIGENVDLATVRGKRVWFSALRAMSRAPREQHDKMIVAAEAEATTRSLELMARGEEEQAPGIQELYLRAARLGRQQLKVMGQIKQQLADGGEMPAEEMRVLLEVGAEQQGSLAEVTGQPPRDPGGSEGPVGPAGSTSGAAKADPAGSTSAASDAGKEHPEGSTSDDSGSGKEDPEGSTSGAGKADPAGSTSDDSDPRRRPPNPGGSEGPVDPAPWYDSDDSNYEEYVIIYPEEDATAGPVEPAGARPAETTGAEAQAETTAATQPAPEKAPSPAQASPPAPAPVAVTPALAVLALATAVITHATPTVAPTPAVSHATAAVTHATHAVTHATAAVTPPAAAAFTPSLQLPPEVLAFRPLFRFFHEELPEGPQYFVQNTLGSLVRGEHPRQRVLDLHRELRPFLPQTHPLKKQLSQLGGLLRGEGMSGRRFALYALLAARLPGCEKKLQELGQAALPEGLLSLVRFYRDLLVGPPYS